jgi:hypothetical protein
MGNLIIRRLDGQELEIKRAGFSYGHNRAVLTAEAGRLIKNFLGPGFGDKTFEIDDDGTILRGCTLDHEGGHCEVSYLQSTT